MKSESANSFSYFFIFINVARERKRWHAQNGIDNDVAHSNSNMKSDAITCSSRLNLIAIWSLSISNFKMTWFNRQKKATKTLTFTPVFIWKERKQSTAEFSRLSTDFLKRFLLNLLLFSPFRFPFSQCPWVRLICAIKINTWIKTTPKPNFSTLHGTLCEKCSRTAIFNTPIKVIIVVCVHALANAHLLDKMMVLSLAIGSLSLNC